MTMRFAGVDKIHRREDAEPARLGHCYRAEVQGLRDANRSLRRNVEGFEHSQRMVGGPASDS